MKTPLNLIGYVLTFGLARGSLFMAPILVSNMLSVEDYGKIELAQATGAIVGLLASMGLSGTVPLILVRKEITARWDTLLLYMAGVGLALFGVFLVAMAISTPAFSFWVLVPLVSALILLQGLWSATLKSTGHSTFAVLLDTGFWLAVLAGTILVYIFAASTSWVIATLSITAVALLGTTITAYRICCKPFGFFDIAQNLHAGWPLLVTTLFTLIATTAGRVLLGQAAGIEAVGLYSVLFRTTALPIVIHQILIIGFFRQLFSWEQPHLRQRTPVIIWGIGLSIGAFLLLVGPLGWVLGPRFVDVFSRYPLQGKILLFQTLLWSGIALNDLLNSRAQIAGKVVRWTGAYLVLALSLLSWVLLTHVGMNDKTVALSLFVPTYAVLMFGYFTVQCYAMYRQGNTFVLLWASTYGIFFTGMAFLIIQSADT